MKSHHTGDVGGVDVLPVDFRVLCKPESCSEILGQAFPGILTPVCDSGRPTASSS